jgi:hypothetical protein
VDVSVDVSVEKVQLRPRAGQPPPSSHLVRGYDAMTMATATPDAMIQCGSAEVRYDEIVGSESPMR